MKLVRLLCLLHFLPGLASAAEGATLRDGEELTYRVAWGIFGNAGEIKISADSRDESPIPHLSVVTITRTRGVLEHLFPFEGRGECVFDQRTGQLLFLTERSESRKKKTNTAMTFDYDNATAQFTDHLEPSRNRVLPLPDGEPPMDLITSLVHTRTWNLQPGEKQDINVAFEKEIYELTVYAVGYETVETRMGRFKTLKLEPRMEKTPPKGMFKRGSKVHVWIAQDDPRQLPVKFEVEFKFGAGVATLIDYDPPTAATAAAPAMANVP